MYYHYWDAETKCICFSENQFCILQSCTFFLFTMCVCLHLQSRLLSQLKKGTATIKAALPRIKDVNVIDKYSRVIFPVSFLVFNIAYWSFYILAEN